MSRVDDNDLLSKFISALTIFSERSVALETKVISELGAMRNDINQLKQTIASEHNTVSLPCVMEQQRTTMIELIRQIQPILAAATVSPLQPAHQPLYSQPPTVVVSPLQQPAPAVHPLLPTAPVQQLPVVQPPPQPPVFQPSSQTSVVQPPSQPPVSVTPFMPQACVTPTQSQAHQANSKFGEQYKLKEGDKPQTFDAPIGSANSLFGVGGAALSQQPPQKPVQVKSEEKPAVNFSFTAKSNTSTPTSNLQSTGLFSAAKSEAKPVPPINFSFAPNQSENVQQSKTSSVTVVSQGQRQESKNLFGGSVTSPGGVYIDALNSNLAVAQQKPLLSGLNNTSSMSFASMAANTSENSSFFNKSESNASTFAADPKQFSFLSGVKSSSMSTSNKPVKFGEDDNGDKDETAPEEFVPDESQFKRPDIALPDLVEVQTGEENEDIVFSARCRLYRFLPGAEVKERGTGDLKLLKSRETGKMRCVMRREQVLKVCANFAIPPGFEVHSTKRGENVLTWSCKDFSDPDQKDGEFMTLICRFKDVDTAKKFKGAVHSASA